MKVPLYPFVGRRFWELVADGCSPVAAGAALGVSKGVARGWFADAGGMKPRFPDPSATRTRPRLTLEEREEIQDGVARQESIRDIARRLGRHPSTVMREIGRNASVGGGRYRARHRFGAPWRGGWECVPRYRASTAHARAHDRARRSAPGKLATNARLHDEVQARLDEQHSPAQISRRLRLDFPDEAEMRVSHEMIYQAIYVQGKGNLRRELHTCLRTGRALRKPHRRPDERRGRIPNMVNISERPPEVEDRAVPGHWESQWCCQAA